MLENGNSILGSSYCEYFFIKKIPRISFFLNYNNGYKIASRSLVEVPKGASRKSRNKHG